VFAEGLTHLLEARASEEPQVRVVAVDRTRLSLGAVRAQHRDALLEAVERRDEARVRAAHAEAVEERPDLLGGAGHEPETGTGLLPPRGRAELEERDEVTAGAVDRHHERGDDARVARDLNARAHRHARVIEVVPDGLALLPDEAGRVLAPREGQRAGELT